MPNGYHGNILRVDLTTAAIDIEKKDAAFYRKYMGGSALNLHYFLTEMPAGIDALDPQNILALSVGVSTGVTISGQSRMTAIAKSPLTGAIGDSQCGGFWPAWASTETQASHDGFKDRYEVLGLNQPQPAQSLGPESNLPV